MSRSFSSSAAVVAEPGLGQQRSHRRRESRIRSRSASPRAAGRICRPSRPPPPRTPTPPRRRRSGAGRVGLLERILRLGPKTRSRRAAAAAAAPATRGSRRPAPPIRRPRPRAGLLRLPRGGRDRGPNLRGDRIRLPPRRGERALPVVARDRPEERRARPRPGGRRPRMRVGCPVKASCMSPPCAKRRWRPLKRNAVCRQVIRTPDGVSRRLRPSTRLRRFMLDGSHSDAAAGQRHQHLVHAAPVHVRDLEAPARPFEMVPRDRDAAKLRDDEAAQRLELRLVLVRQRRPSPRAALNSLVGSVASTSHEPSSRRFASGWLR
jgi:hypothetical protein